MSLTKSIIKEAALAMPKAALTRPLPRGEERERGSKKVKSEIGRVKFQISFPISLFTLHSSPFPPLRDTLLPKLLSGELNVTTK